MNEERLRKSPNIAIVGSTSLLGKELREMLEAGGFPMGKLALLETEEYAGLLQEFASEIRITQVISPEAFEDIDIAFFTCSPEIMHSYVGSGAKFPELTIDLTQAGAEGTVYLQGISDPRVLRSRGYFVNPHPAAIVIALVLSSLHNTFGVQSAAVTVLEPASERGNAGVDELQEQTVNLLNFQQIGNKVFNGQLAFNILPEREASERTENRILEHLVGILGKTFPKPVITAVQAPVFYSHAFSVFVQLLGTPAVEEVIAQLHRSGGSVTDHAVVDGPSPVGVVGTDTIHLGRVRRGGNQPGAYALWLVADNLRIAAANAIRTAEHIMLAPALDT
jgi:aspartate-semialdehyde dehydrogenase